MALAVKQMRVLLPRDADQVESSRIDSSRTKSGSSKGMMAARLAAKLAARKESCKQSSVSSSGASGLQTSRGTTGRVTSSQVPSSRAVQEPEAAAKSADVAARQAGPLAAKLAASKESCKQPSVSSSGASDHKASRGAAGQVTSRQVPLSRVVTAPQKQVAATFSLAASSQAMTAPHKAEAAAKQSMTSDTIRCHSQTDERVLSGSKSSQDKSYTLGGSAVSCVSGAVGDAASMALRHEALGKPMLQQLSVLQELHLSEQAADVQAQMKEMLVAAHAFAEGEAGDSTKYEIAARTCENRWRLFLTTAGYSVHNEPTLQMVEEFTVFMFKFRQLRSSADKAGLGDSSVLLARYTLGQKVFPVMGYSDWQGQSAAELRTKSKPFSDKLAETWQRLRRALPEMKSSEKPFVKYKWSEEAYFHAQDTVYELMDSGAELVNVGLTWLMVMAMPRASCQRSGSMAKDSVDMRNGSVWGPDGLNVLSVKDLVWSRSGMNITFMDGTTELGASRAELTFNRLKHHYFVAAAGGYEYLMSITPDAEAVVRRSADIACMYLMRRGLFAVQYSGMTPKAIEAALASRRENGYPGGMPPGAVIDAEEAVRRFVAGEKQYLKQVEDEPLLVMLQRGGSRAFLQQEMTTRVFGEVFASVTLEAGFKPGSGGVNNIRRSTMSLVQKGAERLGFDPSMHAKRMVNHRSVGHGTREGVYEDCTNTTDMGAFLMQRRVESIEGLADLAATRCSELRKYRKPDDVRSRDPLWKLLHKNEGLLTLRAAAKRLSAAVQDEGEVADDGCLRIIQREIQSTEAYLKRKVLLEKQKAVYDSHCEALKTMPLDELQAMRTVNSYDGITLSDMLLRYGCGVEVPFEVEAILASQVRKGKNGGQQYLLKWRGYRAELSSWEAAENVSADLIAAFARPVESESSHNQQSPSCDVVAAAVPAEGGKAVLASTPSRLCEQDREGRLAAQFEALLKSNPCLTQKAALAALADQDGMSVHTLRKKVQRAKERVKQCSEGMRTLKFTVDGGLVELSVARDELMASVLHKLAAHLVCEPSKLRMLADGERIALGRAVSSVQPSDELEAVFEVSGGADVFQDTSSDSQELPAGGTQPDDYLPAGGTQPEESSSQVEKDNHRDVSGRTALGELIDEVFASSDEDDDRGEASPETGTEPVRGSAPQAVKGSKVSGKC